MAKFLFEGAQATYMVVNISLLYAKILKESEKTYRFAVIIFIIGGISVGGGGRFCPFPGYAHDKVGLKKLRHEKFHSSTACNTSIRFTAKVTFR